VCNSAIWQTNMPATFAAVRRVLGPGGRFAFNIGADCMTMPEYAPSQADSELSLLGLMQQAAAASYGWKPAADPGPRAQITVDSVTALLTAAGFAEPRVAIAEYSADHEATRAWLSIPIFTERRFPGLSYEQRMHALDIAYRQLEKPTAGSSHWVVFTATWSPRSGS
jgi:hypothetical protein